MPGGGVRSAPAGAAAWSAAPAGYRSYGAADPALLPSPRQQSSAAFAKPQAARPWLLTNRQKLQLFLVPLLLSLVLYVLFANVYHRSPHFVLGLVVVLVALLAGQGVVGRRGPPFNMWMVLSCLFALCTTVMVSGIAYDKALSTYWHLYDSNTYTNVLPTEPSAGYADAGKMIFADGTRVDSTKSLGFKNRDMYCVAPIVDDTGPSVIEYWAVGKNCCGARGLFDCDDAWDSKARSAVRMVTEAQEYTSAVKMAEAFYGLGSVKDPMFVRWVIHPEKVESNYWHIGWGIMIGGLLVQQLLFAGFSMGVNLVMKSSLLLR